MKYYDNYKSATKINLDLVGSFKTMKDIISSHKKGKRNVLILDIGCGIGYLTNYFSDIGTIYGIDKNKEAINIAKQMFPNVDFILGDIFSEDIFNKKADIVICYNIIEHLTQEQRKILFSKIKNNILKKDGLIIFGYANPYHCIQLIWGLLTQKVLFDKTHIYNWSKTEFKKVIQEDFSIVCEKNTSPFTKMIWFGKHFKGDIIVCASLKQI